MRRRPYKCSLLHHKKKPIGISEGALVDLELLDQGKQTKPAYVQERSGPQALRHPKGEV